jgi:hypothetical protein
MRTVPLKLMTILAALTVATMSSAATASDCAGLTIKYSKYNVAAAFFDRTSKVDNSTLRQETALSALNNIYARQSIIVDMMIAKGCELPEPPEFDMFGLVNANNG